MIFLEIEEFHNTNETSKTYINLKEICSIQEMMAGTRICMNNGKIFETIESIEAITKKLKLAMEE